MLTQHQIEALRQKFTRSAIDPDTGRIEPENRNIAARIKTARTLSEFQYIACDLAWDLESFALVISKHVYSQDRGPAMGWNNELVATLCLAHAEHGLDPRKFEDFSS